MSVDTSNDTKEVRHIASEAARLQLEIRAGAKKPVIVGMPIVFGVRSLELFPGFREVIHKEAMEYSLKHQPDVRAFVDHDPGKVLGRTKSGTLRLNLTDRGLGVEIDPPDTTDAANVMESIRRGDVDGMSFSLRVPPGGDKWHFDEESGTDERHVYEMIVSEVSVVSMPAYVETSVAVRSLEQFRSERQPRRSVNVANNRLRLAKLL